MTSAKDDWRAWERNYSAQIVRGVNALREELGLTIGQLAVRLAEYGWPVDTGTLTGILSANKRASISVAEVFALARALSTHPLYLMVGHEDDLGLPAGGPLADAPMTESAAIAWIVGDDSPLSIHERSRDLYVAAQTARASRAVRDLGNAVRKFEAQNAIVHLLPIVDEGKALRDVRAVYTEANLRWVLVDIRAILNDSFRSGEPDDDNLRPRAHLSPLLEAAALAVSLDDVKLPIEGLVTGTREAFARRYLENELARARSGSSTNAKTEN